MTVEVSFGDVKFGVLVQVQFGLKGFSTFRAETILKKIKLDLSYDLSQYSN